ncbi:DUF3016 domain-containing protein [Pseudoalteromonas fenneropenaei]|uniref:DUF3016 domain-containing protein n=1 Tax=Pseudoalteromonas fenneropenaei TaxID=1737459 RepID=A0ABV7CLR4_9GAMM
MKLSSFLATLALASLSMSSYAAAVAVKWQDFNKYRDVYPSNQAKGSYHKYVAEQFEKHLNKLAEQLPSGYTLTVNFDDVDLAGDVHYGIQELRIIKPIHFPRLTISYELKDAAGKVLLTEQQKVLKDMAFMDRSRLGTDSAFYYDKRLLTEWFNDTVVPASKAG